ncbi:MAG: type III pantothenate kinase [Candidatus Nanopelagicales bacterium]|jgi:type III pantothenate kinase|nr:type III pantothenate kinase [Candidatus Nanopelagicales bacterium]MBJ7393147.1 type III pantothenate kinase [Candidatus Nanopelagicales bacterium]
MLLAIDVGNTNTVLGLYDNEKLIQNWRIKTDTNSTADELILTYNGLLKDQPKVTGISLCSTVPSVLREMRWMLERYFPEAKTVIIEPGTKTGVPIITDNPKEVGADRIANSLAVFERHGGPSVVVDFGTSTNFDVVSEKGEFLGGALAPGIEISLEALANRAAQLRKVEFVKPRSVIGKNTVEALQSGALYGFAGQVDGILQRIIAEIGPLKAVVATGGLAPLVVEESSTITHHEPDLTLEGLRLVFEKNK